MTSIDALRQQMEAAAAAEDFALAAKLRDQISLLRGQGGDGDAAAIDPAGLTRQQPGKMGLGTSQQRYTPPPGWTPPVKPDPMTRGRGRKKT
jgi:hypothetical protein